MDEQAWLACTDPELMLRFLPERPSERRLRLFALACCRRVWHLFPNERWERLVEVAERFVDRAATRAELNSAWWRVPTFQAPPPEYPPELLDAANGLGVADLTPRRAQAIAYAVAKAVARVADETTDVEAYECPLRDAERAAQSDLLRDLCGNAFRPLTGVNAWRTPSVLALAQAAYDKRTLPAGTLEPDRLAVLADALEEVGCTDADILGHLRGPGPHIRGCWSLDLIRGAE